jgi:cysteamine dioxygenase
VTLTLAAGSHSRVRFLDVLDHEAVSVSVIVFAAGSGVPLHDHPGMHAFSKVLAGQLHGDIYDLLQPLPQHALPIGSLIEVRNRRSFTMAGSDIDHNAPVDANIHSLRCASDGPTSVLLTIMLPPYAPREDACHFFSTSSSDSQLRVIEEVKA